MTWRQGVKQQLQSRFAALRVRPTHRDRWRAEPHPEEWLLIEWTTGESEPIKYWLSTLSADTILAELASSFRQTEAPEADGWIISVERVNGVALKWDRMISQRTAQSGFQPALTRSDM